MKVKKINIPAMILLAIVALSSCSTVYYVLDTTSETIDEYENDFYVHKVDSSLELHYNLWSDRGAFWLSALNLMDDVIFMITDSCYIEFEDDKYPYDLLVEDEQYAREVLAIPGLSDYKLGEFYPVVKDGWKGFLGSTLPFNLSSLKQQTQVDTFSMENSPYVLVSQVCYYKRSGAIAPVCIRDTVWVNNITSGDPGYFRSLEKSSTFTKTDKFYVTKYGYE